MVCHDLQAGFSFSFSEQAFTRQKEIFLLSIVGHLIPEPFPVFVFNPPLMAVVNLQNAFPAAS